MARFGRSGGRMIVGVLLVCFLGALGGCGPALVRVKGHLVRAGQPYQLAEKEYLVITFALEEPEGQVGQTIPANLKPNGTFEVIGRTGNGIPPGSYKIVVAHGPDLNLLMEPGMTGEKMMKLIPPPVESVKQIGFDNGELVLNVDTTTP